MIIKSDIVIFKGQGIVFKLLSLLLSIFDTTWRRLKWKPWHTAIVWRQGVDGWFLLEATGQGVQENFYPNTYLQDNCRIYHWLISCPEQAKMDKFFEEHILKAYDVTIYFWTALQYLVRHFYNRVIPRLLDNRYTCWELVFEFCEQMGRHIGSDYDCPMIADMIKAFEEAKVVPIIRV